MEPIVEKYTNFYKRIFEEKTKVTGIKDPERNCGEVVQLFSAVNDSFTELFKDIAYKIDEDEALRLKTKGLIIKHGLKVDIPGAGDRRMFNPNGYEAGSEKKRNYNSGMSSEKPPIKGNYMNLFNEVLLDLEKLDLKQNLLSNIGLIDLCFETLIFCCGDYLQYPRHYKKRISGQFFSDNLLFGKGEFVEWNMFLRNDLVVKSLVILFYACL
jgi:hypothetical protein